MRIVARPPEHAAPLSAAAGDGRDEHDLVTILELVGVAAEEPDVLIVDVDVDELAKIAAVVLDVLGERGKLGVELGQQSGKVFGFAGEGFLSVGVASQCGGEGYLYAHRAPPASTRVSSAAFALASEPSTSRRYSPNSARRGFTA